jgi:F-type H+-transporting ATPase subunit gamma
MSYELKKAEGRLDNIRNVKPILAALRTISLGSWQMARNRRAGLSDYIDRLLSILPDIVPHIVGVSQSVGGPRILGRKPFLSRGRKPRGGDDGSAGRVVVLVIGSERGLCGRYNKALLDALMGYLDEVAEDVEVELGALGSRLTRELRQADCKPSWDRAMSITALPDYTFAHGFAVDWLARFEAFELDAVDVIYNADRGAGTYEATTVRLIPPELPPAPAQSASEDPVAARMTSKPIIETDPMQLYVRVIEQWTAIALYRYLLDAAVTEHLARFQLMESAMQNSDDLIAELMLTVNSARRQAITREMQELAVSAGLLT